MSRAQATVVGPDEAEIRGRFGVPETALLGAGGESRVFALDESRVLRIFHATHEQADAAIADLLSSWSGVDIEAVVPVVLEAGRTGTQSWTVDRRIPGHALLTFLQRTRDDEARHRALLGALDVSARLRELPLPASGFRRVFDQPPREFDSLPALIDHQIEVGTALNWNLLAQRVPDLVGERARLLDELADREVSPAFVHGDYFPGNVLCDEGGQITGVCDFSVHALAADPVLDQVGAVCLLGDYPEADADARWMADALRERLGVRNAWLVDAYRRFYGFYYAMDADLIDWAAAQFRP